MLISLKIFYLPLICYLFVFIHIFSGIFGLANALLPNEIPSGIASYLKMDILNSFVRIRVRSGLTIATVES